MSNVKYTFSKDGQTAYGEMPDGSVFMIDSDRLPEVSDINFYLCRKGYGQEYPMDCNGRALHSLIST